MHDLVALPLVAGLLDPETKSDCRNERVFPLDKMASICSLSGSGVLEKARSAKICRLQTSPLLLALSRRAAAGGVLAFLPSSCKGFGCSIPLYRLGARFSSYLYHCDRLHWPSTLPEVVMQVWFATLQVKALLLETRQLADKLRVNPFVVHVAKFDVAWACHPSSACSVLVLGPAKVVPHRK
jgi:hypothetical protein